MGKPHYGPEEIAKAKHMAAGNRQSHVDKLELLRSYSVTEFGAGDLMAKYGCSRDVANTVLSRMYRRGLLCRLGSDTDATRWDEFPQLAAYKRSALGKAVAESEDE